VRSALARLVWTDALNAGSAAEARENLSILGENWVEVVPSNRVRSLAETLPDRYRLRAADAFQLAAALVWSEERPHGRRFVCLNRRMAQAAREAGFEVIEG